MVYDPLFSILTDTGEDLKLVHSRKRPKVDTLFSSLFSDASERRVENTRVHFWTFSPVTVNSEDHRLPVSIRWPLFEDFTFSNYFLLLFNGTFIFTLEKF